MNVRAAQRALPCVGRPLVDISEDIGAFRHSLAKRQRHAVQVLLRKAQSFKACPSKGDL